MDTLLEGNRRYVQRQALQLDVSSARRRAVAAAQHPFACIVGCADSRVPPEIIFDQGLGDVFTVRVAGTILDAAVMGSVEFAVAELGVPLVLVLGHEACGAVTAALKAKFEHERVPGHIAALLRALHPAIGHLPDASDYSLDEGVRRNASLVAAKLRHAEPVLAQRAASAQLTIVAARYGLRDGVVTLLDR